MFDQDGQVLFQGPNNVGRSLVGFTKQGHGGSRLQEPGNDTGTLTINHIHVSPRFSFCSRWWKRQSLFLCVKHSYNNNLIKTLWFVVTFHFHSLHCAFQIGFSMICPKTLLRSHTDTDSTRQVICREHANSNMLTASEAEYTRVTHANSCFISTVFMAQLQAVVLSVCTCPVSTADCHRQQSTSRVDGWMGGWLTGRQLSRGHAHH